jgi:hypothetical protein
MNRKMVLRSLARAGIVAWIFLLAAAASSAQGNPSNLSGTVTGTSEKPVVGAKISLKNSATGQVANSETNSAGFYSFQNLSPGDYEISVSAVGFDTKTATVSLAPGASQNVNFALMPSLSLQDLGISPQMAQGNPREQARLDKRSRMLQIHQRLGLITVAPLAATVISGFFAGGKTTSSASRDLHVALGATTAGLYFSSAYYAIFAPKIKGVKSEGPIRWHKALAWIHGPGMILTPILGAMAYAQRSNGERVHGIAHYHGQVAIVTAAAYGLAILSVSLKSGSAAKSAHAFLSLFHRKHSAPVAAFSKNAPVTAAAGVPQ